MNRDAENGTRHRAGTIPKVLAVIPARAGSKSVHMKNIAELAGKPLIAYTISVALAARKIDRTVVSTDSPEIARIARSLGAEVPFLRPSELSQDDTPGMAPILHAMKWLQDNQGYRPDYVICLQPTSPLRSVQDVESALDMAVEKDADSVVSVTPAEHHPYLMKRIGEDGRISDFISLDRPLVRRQDLSPVYAVNGAIYLARCDVLLNRQTWYTDRTYAHIMPPERSTDIDTEWDLYITDLILRDKAAKPQ